MKTKSLTLMAAILFATATPIPAATNDLSGALQKGLFEEEANHNLDAAIAAYQSVATQFDKDRKLAATAIFRLGEVYRKQGKTNEADIQYERIIREFSDQPELVKLSRNFAKQTSDSATNQSQLSQMIVEAQGDYEKDRTLLDSLKKLSRADLRKSLPILYPSSELDDLFKKLASSQQKLAGLLTEFTPEYPDVRKEQAIINLVEKQIDEKMDGIVLGLETRIFSSQQRIKILRQQREETFKKQTVIGVEAIKNEPFASTDEEEKEIRRIKAIIKDSPDLINAQTTALTEGENPERGTPLHKAASLGQLVVAQFLLANGADTELKSVFSSTSGNTALNLAARNGHKAMVELLLAKGANIQAVGYWGHTPLHSAASRGYKAVVEVLLKNNADINAKNNDNDTPLHLAVAKGYRTVVELLLSHNPDVNAKNNKGFTPLFLAIENKNIELAKLLIANKADVKLAADKSSDTGWTPLHKAVEMGDVRLIELLLQNGAKLEQKVNQYQRKNGAAEKECTPLHIAVDQGRPEVVEFLLKNGANPNSMSAYDVTPLFFAVRDQNKQIVKLLLDQKADVNAKNSGGYTPLHSAVTGSAEIAQLLVDHGAEVNSKSKDGNTPLHLAIQSYKKSMVELLLANKADPNIQNGGGQTPLGIVKGYSGDAIYGNGAESVTRKDLIDLLEKYGANENTERLSRISIRRQSGTPVEPVYFRSKNSNNGLPGGETLPYQWKKNGNLNPEAMTGARNLSSANRYSLFELLAKTTYPFPELSKIKINRLDPATQKTRDIPVNLEEILKSGDCSKDIWLEWGDIIEIPEADHLVNASWSGFPKEYMEMAQKCLERKVSITVKGETTNLTLRATIHSTPSFRPGQHASDSWRISVPPQFYLNQLLIPYLRASSDKTRVRVKRTNLVTKKAQEIIINLEKEEDLWLRDGDSIEIPERDPNAPPAASGIQQGNSRTIPPRPLKLPETQAPGLQVSPN